MKMFSWEDENENLSFRCLRSGAGYRFFRMDDNVTVRETLTSTNPGGVIPQGEGDLFQMVVAQRIGFAPGLQIHSGRCAEASERQRHEQTDQQLAADRGHRVVGIR